MKLISDESRTNSALKPAFSSKFVVPFSDIDMAGHVNNARYFVYFENARIQHMYSMEGKSKFGEMGVVLAHAEIDYKSPARFQDELRIDLCTVSVGNSSWVIEYEIYNVIENRLVATGKTVQVSFDYKAGKPVPISPTLKEKLLQEAAKSRE